MTKAGSVPRSSGLVSGRFLVPASAAGAAVVIGRGAPVLHPGAQSSILIVKSWDPAQALSIAYASGVVILSRSPTSHAAMIALHLAVPSCYIEPDHWVARMPAWVELRHAEGLVTWKPLSCP